MLDPKHLIRCQAEQLTNLQVIFRLNANIPMTVRLCFLEETLSSSPSFLESPCILKYSTGTQTLKEVSADVG